MTENAEFKLRQARYDLLKTIEILFNKKTEERINVKVPYERLISQVSDFIPVALDNREKIISSVLLQIALMTTHWGIALMYACSLS